jgi:hypothetical protein
VQTARDALLDDKPQERVLHAVPETADGVAGECGRKDRPGGLRGHSGALEGECDERERRRAAARQAPGEPGGAGDHGGHPDADDPGVGGVTGTQDLLDVEDLDGEGGADEEQRRDIDEQDHAQDWVAPEMGGAVAGPLRDRRRGGRPPGPHQRGRRGDGEEAAGVDEQRQPLAAEGDDHACDGRSHGEAGTARGLQHAVGAPEPSRRGDVWDQRELGRLSDRSDAREQGRQREDRREVAREGERDRDGGRKQRADGQQPHGLHPVHELAGHWGDRDHRHHRCREQRRNREGVARQVVDQQGERDQREQVPGGREKHRARE